MNEFLVTQEAPNKYEPLFCKKDITLGTAQAN